MSNCDNCESNYFKVENKSLQTGIDVESFNTDKYLIHIYKNKNSQATKISCVDNEANILAWINTELKIKKYNTSDINNKIKKLIMFS